MKPSGVPSRFSVHPWQHDSAPKPDVDTPRVRGMRESSRDAFVRGPTDRIPGSSDAPPHGGKRARNLRIAGWSTMALGIVSLAFLPVVGIAPAGLLIPLASLMLNKGGAKPLE